MKKLIGILIISATFMSCSPVIRKDLMSSASRHISFATVKENQDIFKGKLFVLGGIIAETKVSNDGSIIEALYVPVDRYGYLKDVEMSSNRFKATYDKSLGFLDPLIYSKGREITVAGEFTGTMIGKIDEMEYVFPVFKIKDLYLWSEEDYYDPYLSYPYWYDPYYSRWRDPWWYGPYYPYYPPYRHYPYRYGPYRRW
jgi:outer membrane lipoprotein